MKLERQHAAKGALGLIFVHHVKGLFAVDELLQVVALGDDDIIIPVALLNRGLDFSGIADRADDLLLPILAEDNLLAAPRVRALNSLFFINAFLPNGPAETAPLR